MGFQAKFTLVQISSNRLHFYSWTVVSSTSEDGFVVRAMNVEDIVQSDGQVLCF